VKIAYVLYPDFTALDLVRPYEGEAGSLCALTHR
jgi:hypothetical protein